MARRMEFRKPRLGEYTTASNLCLCQHPPEVSHCSRNRISVSSGKGLNFITNNVVLLLKFQWKLKLIRSSYDKKSANVVMKDEEYKYIFKQQ